MTSLRKRYTLEQPVKAVFAAWISPANTVPPVTRVDVDPRPGGHFRLTVGDDAARMEGRVLAIEPERHIRYSWCWDGGPESLVDVRFEAAGAATVVSLEHSGLAAGEDAERHAAGWDSYIAGLRGLLDRG